MPLDPDRLLALDIAPRRAVYDDRDVLLYALSLGAGLGDDLRLVQEEGLNIVPSFAQVLAYDDSWMAGGGIDLAHVVHGSLDLSFEAPLAPAGTAEVRNRIAGMTDKGAGRGGIVHQEITIRQGGATACTALSSLFVRGGGGFGGSTGKQAEPVAIPDRPADARAQIPTRIDQSLFFRLLGDRNPLHALPHVARAAGFDRPILHGACTFGIACLTVLTRYCGGDPARMARFAARFTGPLYPGETLSFEFWSVPDGVRFRAATVERGTAVLDGGLAEIRPSQLAGRSGNG